MCVLRCTPESQSTLVDQFGALAVMGLGHTSDLILSSGDTGEATRITASRLWPKLPSLALAANTSYTYTYHIQTLL
jgi:hypothetical protein